MEIKLFGKTLFSAKKSKAEALMAQAIGGIKESKYLPDFYSTSNAGSFNDYIAFSDSVITNISGSSSNPAGIQISKGKKKAKTEPKKEDKVVLTPKDVYNLKMLHDNAFVLNADPEYVEKQLAGFKDKLGLIKSEEFDMRHGVNELSSIVMRLENRKKYPEVKEFFEEYPYTTSSKIEELVKAHDYLKMGQVAQFIADMPKEAIDTMKGYDAQCMSLCEKKAVFYIIADKKDFKQTNSRRDPILLAQSPFGHVWQILGAWDKEMMFIEEL